MSEAIWHLKRCNLFERLTDEQLRWIESRSRSRSFPRKSPIYLPSEPAEAVYVLTGGRAKICHITPDGKQSILAFIEPGELFGELAILDPRSRDEYAETVDASTVIMIPGSAMEQLMQKLPDLSLGITKIMGLRRRRIERRLRNLLFQSNRERLTHLLLELLEQYGQKTDQGVRLRIALSHQELANIIGSTRETVTVTLGEMQLQGLLSVGRRRIVVTDPARLAASVSQPEPTLPDGQKGKTAPVF